MRRSDLSAAVIASLERFPAPDDSHYGVVPSAPPQIVVDIGEARPLHAKALEAIARVDTLANELDDPYLISRVLARREAVTSSSIEGTNSTLDALLSVEEGEEPAEDATGQVRDYALTLERFLPQAQTAGPDIFTVDHFCALHLHAMQNEPKYNGTPGTLREQVVWIGGSNIAYSTYNPPPPGRVRNCLEDTAAYMRGEGMQVMTHSLIVKMAIAHAHFEGVHPFADGNGRVGRLLLPLMMAADGHTPLYLAPYIEANKTGYYSALKAAQQRLDWAELIAYLSHAIIETVDELLETRRVLKELRSEWQTRRKFRAGSAALRALDILTDYPVITANRLAERLCVTPPQVSAALTQLEGAGILTERTGYKRNRIFLAREVLTVLNRPFGAKAAERD